ncbi:hypothetical protein G6F70_000106 [Rhizopus microsporus]|uniref:BZIP domain-containing protein n=1 Tax=Rhizopus microsporus TaxID=58291 RepID=A0A1X0SFK6_RHIZD|nr:hypothetical protein G6F71_001858 [Rhizopus microsporus]KAG1204800.1 hypothetical protein G6F70_000106 [Rhizopus microsporus]KAG1236204.1 hypothetical protein G6F67_002174 [Rhizopus microsporus]KAG1265051.1 hypothetical protein G6F68_003896 [Rhizopus microsporus]ORE22941.1 hypothetical protein BCV71DRAFT_247286 [Rhizopus microsporus]
MDNNNNNNNNIFTWIFDTPQQQQQVNSLFINDNDLFAFLMNPNEHQIEQEKKNNREMINNNSDSSSKSTTSHSSDSSQSAGGEEGFISYKLDNIKSTDIIQKTPAEFTSSTGKLDFRHINSNITENQLKAMTSKERRQLRNKISARNFRNRRKEYIEGIEKELQQQKIENSQMKLEIKWLKSKVEQLQAENDKLRIDVAVLNSLPAPSVLAPYSSSPDIEPSPMLSNDNNNNNNNAVDDWDFVLPDFPSSQPDTFISQAVVPSFNQVFLSKEQQQKQTHSSDLIKQYPLLAPALMSIILSHTMTMSTDQLLASAKLIPPSPLPSKKEAEAVWNLLEPIRVMNERNNRLVITDTEKQEKEEEEKEEEKEKKEESKCGMRRCLISLLQSTIYNHVAEMIANHKAKPIEEKPFLCRSYTKAMKYITA